MKTWEIVKELTENPNKRFKTKGGPEDSYVTVKNGKIVWLGGMQVGQEMAIGLIGKEAREWEEVKEPVDFMTAFKAWHDEQRTIRHEREYEKEIITVTRFNGKNEYANFGAGLILSGKWYIED